MLGTIVHPSHLNQGYLPTSASALRLPAASASDYYTPSDEISFIEMDSPMTSSRRLSDSTGAKETWATKVRQTMGRRSASSKEIEVIGQDLSFFDMRKDGRGWRKHRPYASSPAAGCLGSGERGFCDKPPELSASEKMQATRKAKKLSQVGVSAGLAAGTDGRNLAKRHREIYTTRRRYDLLRTARCPT